MQFNFERIIGAYCPPEQDGVLGTLVIELIRGFLRSHCDLSGSNKLRIPLSVQGQEDLLCRSFTQHTFSSD